MKEITLHLDDDVVKRLEIIARSWGHATISDYLNDLLNVRLAGTFDAETPGSVQVVFGVNVGAIADDWSRPL